MTTFEIEFDVLFQGEGKFEKKAKLRLGLDESVSGFLDPQDAQAVAELFYKERICEVTSITRV